LTKVSTHTIKALPKITSLSVRLMSWENRRKLKIRNFLY